MRIRLRQEPDGVWYIKAGLLGPAMCVTDRYVVFSWSPRALREVRGFFEAPVATAPAAN